MTVFNLFSLPTAAATASGSLSGTYGADKAFDGNNSTYWLTSAATSGSPKWLQVHSTTAAVVDDYSVRGHPTSTLYSPKDWVLQGSNDGSTWTDLHTVTAAAWASASTVNSYTFTNTTAYTYYRLYITATNGATDYVGISECSLMSSMIGSASASSAAIGFGAKEAFDGSPSTRWMATAAATSGAPQWLKRTPAAPLAVNAYQMSGHPSSTIYNPTEWKVQGSDDDSTWTDLDTRSGVTWSGPTEVKEYAFTNTTAYAHYRLHVTAVNGATDYTAVSEWAGGYDGPAGAVLVDPPTANATAAAPVPAVALSPLSLTAPVAVAAAAALTASLSLGITAPAAEATAQTLAPTVTVSAVELVPPAATATATGRTPTITVGGVILTPGSAAASAQAHAPTLTFGAITLAPGAAAATAVAPEPGVAVGGVISLDLPAAVAAAEAYAPAVDVDVVADGGWGWAGSVGSARPAPDVVLEAPVVAPAAVEERPLVRVSHRLVLEQDPLTGEYHGDGTHEIVREVVGVPHLWVDGLDVTYFQDRPVKLGDVTGAIPGGSRVASVEFPQVSVLEARDIPWLRPWAPAEISIVRPGGSKIVCFSGHLISEAGGKGKQRNKVEWTLEGDLGAGGHINLKVPVSLPPVDVGVRIPKLLNEIPGRRFHAMAPFESGIPTRKRGSYTDKVTGHVQDLLATAWTPGGDQLTVFPDPVEARRYHVGFKDLTPKWTISAGAPGIEVDLMWDWSQVHNAIYGFGSGPDGYAWAGWRFPGFVDYDPPDYPLPAGVSMRVGSSGAGVLTWKARLIEMGWALSPGSTYASSDVSKVRAFQTERGILVDGVVGPQTWNEVWNLGPRDLVAPERFPLAVLPAVEPYLYSETGRILGPNPDFDPTVGRHETDIAYGAGVTFAEGVADAQVRLARESEPGLVGEIKMTSCPWEGSRWEIQEGDALTLLQWRGMDPLLYVSQKKISWDAREVTLTVDTKARDAMTLVEIIKREREARADPAGRPGAVNRSSRTEQDQVVEFDGESPAGRFPRIAIRQGLWTVWVIPVSQVGRLVEVDFTTDSPVAEFSVALFGKPITANRLTALVGPPLSRDDPFTDAADELTAAGIIEAWGTASQPGGYWAGRKSDGAPLKGRMRERSSTEYVSQLPPWIWVAVGSPVSTHIQGRVKPPPSMS